MSEYEAYERGVNAELGWALAGGPGRAPEPENPYEKEQCSVCHNDSASIDHYLTCLYSDDRWDEEYA